MPAIVKKVLLQKSIEDQLYSILPQTDATVVNYTKGSGQDAVVTTVAAELASLATAAASVITEAEVDGMIDDAISDLWDRISGLADGESLAASFDTLKEISDYLNTHGSVVSGFTSDINALKTALGSPAVAADPENEIEAQAATGLFATIAGLDSRITALETIDPTSVEASETNGNIVIDGVETTVYTHPQAHSATMITTDSTHRFVSDAQIAAWDAKADVAVVDELPQTVDEGTLYFVEVE